MNENIKLLDKELKELVKKHSDIFPKFNSGNEILDLMTRMKYAEENIEFNNQIDAIKENYDIKNSDITFLFKMYKDKYIHGFNFPATLERYETLI